MKCAISCLGAPPPKRATYLSLLMKMISKAGSRLRNTVYTSASCGVNALQGGHYNPNISDLPQQKKNTYPIGGEIKTPHTIR